MKYQQTNAQVSASDEWLTVKLRYKQPEGETSVPFDVAVTPRTMADTGRISDLPLRWPPLA